jgi:hypothetical protein
MHLLCGTTFLLARHLMRRPDAILFGDERSAAATHHEYGADPEIELTLSLFQLRLTDACRSNCRGDVSARSQLLRSVQFAVQHDCRLQGAGTQDT